MTSIIITKPAIRIQAEMRASSETNSKPAECSGIKSMGCQKGQKAKRSSYLYIGAPIYISELLFIYGSSYLYIGASICI